MINNAGLKKVCCLTSTGEIRVFEVDKMIAGWQDGDLLDDDLQYGRGQKV